jgi:antibiotic biosynthesis monooxygenase (ABM) superfamily enzyme
MADKLENNFASLITKMQHPADIELEKFTPCLVKLMVSGARAPGFWSAEIGPPEKAGSEEWHLVQRFRSPEEAEAWKSSSVRTNEINDIQKTFTGKTIAITDEIQLANDKNEVSTAIVTDLKPGMEDAYFAWELKMQSVQAAFPGYRGAYIQPPVANRPGQWATLLRFDSPEALERWLAAPQRIELVQQGQAFIKSTQLTQVNNAFPGWFPVDAQGNAPPNWKTAQLVVLGLFPIVMLQIKFLNPYYAGLNQISPVIGNVINMIISCSCVTWITMPQFIKLYGFWLFPEKSTPKGNLLGQLAVLGFLALESALLWHLL